MGTLTFWDLIQYWIYAYLSYLSQDYQMSQHPEKCWEPLGNSTFLLGSPQAQITFSILHPLIPPFCVWQSLQWCVINVENIILACAMRPWGPVSWSTNRPVLLRTFTYLHQKVVWGIKWLRNNHISPLKTLMFFCPQSTWVSGMGKDGVVLQRGWQRWLFLKTILSEGKVDIPYQLKNKLHFVGQLLTDSISWFIWV